MGDLMIGLAKTVVEAALTRAQTAIDEESKLRQKSQRDLVLVTLELEMIYTFLQVANGDRLKNMMVRTWVRQVRDMAYDFQDCIEFVVHLDNKPSWWFRALPSFMAPPRPLDQAVADLEDLKVRAEELSKYYRRYSGISDSESEPKILIMQQQSSSVADRTTGLAMLVDARCVTTRRQGFGDLTRLITKKDKGLQVISVWGSGCDHGTTPIIRKTFNHTEICQNFTYRAWVKLMHPFRPHDFIRSVMAQFHAKSAPKGETSTIGMHVLTKMDTTQENLFMEFERLVTQERYLVVLEGLSNMVDWDAVRTFLPDTKNGSWIIVSTQQSETASMCIGHSYQIVELKRFSDEHSVCALLKASQGDGNNNKQQKGSHYDESKGKEPMAYEVTLTRDVKIISLKEEGNEYMMFNSLVGRKSEMNQLAEYLAKARVSPPSVMSVFGIAGVGKSALVKNLIYENLFYRVLLNEPQYDHCYWVDVTHPFYLRDLYLTILSDFHSEKDPIEECHHLLKEYRCLVVIDDLRSTKEWDLIQASLVCQHSRSVIIVITSDRSVATYCTNNEDLVFNVNPLEGSAAFELFKKEVYGRSSLYGNNWEMHEIVLKCGGIPKVIAAVAGLLARETDKRMGSVNSLNGRIMHHLEYDSLQDLFDWMRSYFYTFPDSLKPCIFYLSIFPCGQIIRRRRLVTRWIAEGYCTNSHNESAEENGEKQVSKLIELSIIQQISSLSTSAANVHAVRMVLCQVNCFIREYIVTRQMEENLVFALGDKCALTTQRVGRHLVILKNWDRDRILFKSIDFSRLRSLTVYGKWESFFISKSMKMLRVLDLEDASALNDADLNKMGEWLHRLKFLSLRGHSEINYLPGSLGRMRQLQTLDIRGTSIDTLPETITRLNKLQYIRAGTTDIPHVSSRWCYRGAKLGVGVEVPRGIENLTALHTLGVVKIGASGAKTMVKQLKKLTQLRKLGVSGINRKNSKEFVISGLGVHLESLSVQLAKDNQGCLDDISLPWQNLRSLKMHGLQDKLPLLGKHLSKLRKLVLEMDTLEKYDIDLLAKLPELFILRLRVKQLQDGNLLHFYAEMYGEELPAYEKVKVLEISCSSSMLQVFFGPKSMRNLELLKLDCSSASYQLTGLNYLCKLKEVLLKGTNDEIIKADLASQLASHPKAPTVKLEEPSSS